MHYQRTGRRALPSADHRCARPGRGRLDMIGPPTVELTMNRLFVIEVPVAPVDRQLGRGNGDEDCARAALHDLPALAGRNDDDFMANERPGPDLGVDTRTHVAAGGHTDGANI